MSATLASHQRAQVWDRSSLSTRSLAWVSACSAAGLALVGYAADVRPLFLGGALGAVAVTAVLVPELVLALFLAAGVIKAAPWLSGLPFDLTLVAALGVLALVIARSLTHGLGRLPLLPATAFAAGLTALILLSVLWSPDPEAGFRKAVQFETLSLLAFVAPTVLIRSRRACVRLMVGLVGFGLLIALTAVSTGSPAAPLVAAGGNEIELGIYSALGLIAAVGYLVMLGPQPWRLLWLLPAALLGHTVLAAGSRGALLSSAAALLFVVGCQLTASRRTRVVTVAVASTVVLLLSTTGSTLAGDAAPKYQQTLFTTETATVLDERGYYFEQGRKIAIEHPMGLGAAGYQAVTGFDYPHNILLELADEQGILGLALFVGLFTAAWRARVTPHRETTPEVILSGSLLILVAAEALVSYDINGNRLLWFALGLALAVGSFEPTTRSHGRNRTVPRVA